MDTLTGNSVRTFRQYLSDTGTTYYTEHHFCGACSQLLNTPSGRRRTPADLDKRGRISFLSRGEDDAHVYYAFCPWCGVALREGWWRKKLVENLRTLNVAWLVSESFRVGPDEN